jgi:hypothetical protein
MAALVRLQDPQNFECPVINAYVQALSSGSSIVFVAIVYLLIYHFDWILD